MFSCHKLTNISIWDFIQQFVSEFLQLSGDGKDVADVALETEELSSTLEKEDPKIWGAGIISHNPMLF